MRKLGVLVLLVLITSLAYGQIRIPKRFSVSKVKSNYTTVSKNKVKGQEVLHYDDGEIEMGIGSNQSELTLGAYLHFPKENLGEFVNGEITKIRFGIDDSQGVVGSTIKIYLGDYTSTEPVYKQVHLNFVDGWNEVELGEPFTIPEGQDLTLGLDISAWGYALSMDKAFDTNNGGIIYVDGKWDYLQNYGLMGEWNIQADVTVPDYDYDLRISDLSNSTADCQLSNSEVLSVKVKNRGTQNITSDFNLIANINGTEITKTVAASTTTFNNEETITVDFPGYDMSALMNYDISVYHNFSDDKIAANDTVKTTLKSRDAVITVDFTSDAYPAENVWAIFDKEGNVVAQKFGFSPLTQDVEDVCVYSTGCYTFAIYDAYGDGISDGGQGGPAGTFTISYNGTEVYTCENPDFGKEQYIYGIADGCPDVDAGLEMINIDDVLEFGDVQINGTILNSGLQNITSFDVTYTIGNYTSPVYSVSGIDVPMGESIDFTHDAAYMFDTEGEYEIVVTVSNVNGLEDENLANNQLSKTVTVVAEIIDLKPMFELFTSSTCPPCASYNPVFDGIVETHPGEYSVIKYQAAWPGAGDPYNIPECNTRAQYYAVTGVPSLYSNGAYNMIGDENDFQALKGLTPFKIEISTAEYDETTVSIKADISSVVDYDAGLKAHIAIIEKTTFGNVGTNGETMFHNVLMEMIPGAEGTQLAAFMANVVQEISGGADMSFTHAEEMEDLAVVVFIQDDNTKEVLQSEMINITQKGTYQIDAKLNSVNTAGDLIVEEDVNITGTVENGGVHNITSFDVVYTIGDYTSSVYSVSGIDIANGESIDFTHENTYVFNVEGNYELVVTISNINGSEDEFPADNQLSKTISVSTTGIKDNHRLNSVEIYPNPSNGVISFTNIEDSKVEIFNILGKKVLEFINVSANSAYNVSSLPNGTYIVRIIGSNAHSTVKKLTIQ